VSNDKPSLPNEGDEREHHPSEEDYPVDRLKARMNQSLAGRPFTVYLVLFAGAATLLLLLLVVWISATGGGDETDQQICTEIAPADARAAVLAGQIQQVNILVDKEHPTESLTGIQLRFVDKSCRQTPQGADIRAELFSVIGAVDLYNNYSDNGIRVHYQGQDIESELLATSAATSLPTVLPTETLTELPTQAAASPSDSPTLVPEPTATPTLTPTETATAPPVVEASPGQETPTPTATSV
jgi:hypothetical protein